MTLNHKSKISKIATQYYNSGYTPIIHGLKEEKVKGSGISRKKPVNLPSCHDNIGHDDILDKKRKSGRYKSSKDVISCQERKNQCNAVSLLTGFRGNIDTSFIVLDIDVPKESESSLINGLEWIKQYNIDTVTAKSANGGIHYYFKYDEELSNNLTKLLLKDSDNKYYKSTIDIRGNGGMIYAPPTKYVSTNRKTKSYVWEKSILDYDISVIPKQLKKAILDGQRYTNNKDKKINKISDAILTNNSIENNSKDQLELTKILMPVLSIDRATNTNTWLQVCGYLWQFGNEGLKLFNSFSKRTLADNYSKSQCIKTFRSYKRSEPDLNAFLSWVSKDIKSYEGFDKEKLLELLKNTRKSLYEMKFDMNISYSEVYKINEIFDFTTKEGVNMLMKYLNHYICALVNTSDPIYYVFSYNKDKKPAEMIFKKSFKNLMGSYSKYIFNFKEGPANIIHVWNTNPKRREYLNEVFDPSETISKDYLNRFVGWNYDILPRHVQIDKSKFKHIDNHIKEILCNGDENLYDYFWKYYASILQNPSEKTGVCMVFTSDQGAGKGIIFEEILGSKIFGGDNNKYVSSGIGNYYNYINKKEDLTAKFNNNMAGKLLTVVDEVDTFAKDYKFASVMKTLITSNSLKLERKCIDAITIRDYNNITMLSNERDITYVESSDRRYNFHSVNNKWVIEDNSTKEFKAKVAKYMNNIRAEGNNHEAMTHLFNYFMRMDLSNFNVRRIPKTKYKKELILKSAGPKLEFFAEKVVYYNFKNGYISNDSLFSNYKDWYKETYRKEDTFTSKTKFGLYVSDMFPFMVPKNKNGTSIAVYINGQKKRAKKIDLDTLNKIKEKLSSKFGFEFDDDDDDIINISNVNDRISDEEQDFDNYAFSDDDYESDDSYDDKDLSLRIDLNK